MKKTKSLFLMFFCMMMVFVLVSCGTTLTYKVNVSFDNDTKVTGYDSSASYKEGTKLTDIFADVVVEKKGYTFNGFSVDQKNVISESDVVGKSDVTVYALFTANKYTLTLKAGEGKFADGTAEKSLEVTFDTKVTGVENPTPNDEYKEFDGWVVEGSSASSSKWDYSVMDGNFTVVASYKDITTAVRFDVAEGENVSVANPIECSAGEKVADILASVTCSKEGYTFKGWSLDEENFVADEVVPVAGVTVKAIFEINSYDLTLVAGEGSVEETSFTYDYKEEFTLAAATPNDTYEKEFTGWYLDEELTQRFEGSYITEDTVLYAGYQYAGEYGFVEFKYKDEVLATVYTKKGEAVRADKVPQEFYYEDYKLPELLVCEWYDSEMKYYDLATYEMTYGEGETLTVTPNIYSRICKYVALTEVQTIDGVETKVETGFANVTGNAGVYGAIDENFKNVKDDAGNYLDTQYSVIYIPGYIKGYKVNRISNFFGYSAPSTNDAYTHATNSVTEEVYIAKEVKEIGTYCFNYLEKLKAVYFEEGSELELINSKAFFHCTSLETIVLPDSVKQIGAYILEDSENGAFSHCSSLKNFVIPANVETIGAYTFYDCYALGDVSIGKNVKFIGLAAFKDAFVEGAVLSFDIEDDGLFYYTEGDVTTASNALYKCNAAEISFKGLVNVPAANLIEKGKYNTTTFMLTSTCQESVLSNYDSYYSINSSRVVLGFFQYNTSLKKVTFDDSIESIGDFAFLGCGDVQLVFPSTVETVEYGVGCFALSSASGKVTLPDTMEVVPAYCYAASSGITGFTNKTPLYTEIGEFAFAECSGITDFTIGRWTESVESTAFYGCETLKSNPDNFIVDEKNTYFSVLTNSEGAKTYILADQGKTIMFDFEGNVENKVFPDGITKIPALYSGSSSAQNTSIKTLTIPSSVVEIEDSAFKYCTELTTIIYKGKSSLESIGKEAFASCYKLAYAYNENAEEQTKFMLPASVKYIGCNKEAYDELMDNFNISSTTNPGSTFNGCKALLEIVFEEGTNIKYIGYDAFYNSSAAFKSVTFPEKANTDGFVICTYAFYNKLDATNANVFNIPSYCTAVGARAFYQWCGVTFPETSLCTELYGQLQGITNASFNVVIPAYITEIKDSAFIKTTLNSVTFAEGSKLTKIGALGDTSNATAIKTLDFSNCKLVTEISGANSLKKFTGCTLTMPSYFFSDKVDFTSTAGSGSLATSKVIITPSYDENTELVEYKLNDFFAGAYFTSITLADGLTEIGDSAFNGCSKFITIVLPASVTKIGEMAFKGCTLLKTINIPTGVTSVGVCAFAKDTALTKVDLPAGVTTIPDGIFEGCTALTSVSMSDDVTSIGTFAFYGCTKLAAINLSTGTADLPSKLTKVDDYAFTKTNALNGKQFTINPSLTYIGYSAFNISASTGALATPLGVSFVFAEGASAAQFTTVGKYGLRNVTFVNAVDGQSIYTETYSLVKTATAYTATLEHTDYSDVVLTSYAGTATVVNVKEGVTRIDANTFTFGPANVEVTIPATVKLIEAGSSSAGAMKNVSKVTFSNLASDDDVLEIGNYAFFECPVSQITFSTTGKVKLGMQAFAGKSTASANLMPEQDLVIPGTVEFTGSGAFKYQWKIKSLTILEGVTSIKESTFDVSGTGTISGTCPITSVVLPSTVTELGSYTFRGMELLRSVTFAKDEEGKTSVLNLGNQFLSGTYVEEFEIPASVTELKSSAFAKSKIKEITIPSTLTTLNTNVFDSCTALTKVVIGDPVNGNSITKVPNRVFYNCSNLQTVIVYGTNYLTPGWTSASYHAFYNSTKAVIYVDDSLIPTYAADAKWGMQAITLKGLSELVESPEVTPEA